MTWNRARAAAAGLYALSLLALALPVPWAGAAGVLALSVAGAGTAWRAARRPGTGRRDRLVWRTVSAALLVQSLALTPVGDVLRVAAVVLLGAAAWMLPRPGLTPAGRRRSVLDALTVVVSAAMVLWYLVLGPALAAPGATAGTVAAAAGRPLLGLVMIFGFVRVLIRGAGPRRPVLLLASGALMLFAGDVWAAHQQIHATPAVVLTAVLCFVLAALDRPGPADRTPGLIGDNLPYAAIATGYGLLAVAAWPDGSRFPWSGLTLGATAITALVVLRQILEQRAGAQAATTDGLTGLADRTRLHDVLTRGLDRDGRAGRSTAVLLLDLNGVKLVNDSLGHKAGDALLTAFARMLREGILGSDVAGRLGGDEFAVVLHDIGTVAHAETVVRRIAAATAEPVLIDGRPVRASASIGIALSGPGEHSADDLLHRADVAMHDAKRRAGDTRWACFTDGMAAAGPGEPSLADELRTAVAEGRLTLLYQPIVGLPDEELVGVEALVRWEHPQRGLLEPDLIIPLAERSGFIGELGRWALREACTRAQLWPGLRLHVNVSPHQLAEDRFSTDVRSIIRTTGMDPTLLVLEMRESALIADEVPLAHLRILTDEGVRTAVDHFGTGYSALSSLTRLPIDMLKIDRSFVDSLDGTAGGAAVAQAVLRLGRVLSLATVAVGVETAAQARELTLLGGVEAQGTYFGRPQPAARIATLVAAARR